MTDKADTWMALYVGAYLADTMHLAREHHGSYLLLIMAAFKNAGWLPNDDGFLATIAKCTSKQWRAERALYAAFFDVSAERWTHKRVTAEWEKAQALTAERSEAGSKGAAKRWQRHRQTHGKAIAEPSGSHRQNDAPSQSQSHSSEPNGSGGAPPGDPVKLLFDAGVELLTSTGCKEPAARSLIGKWRKENGDDAVMSAITEARRLSVTEPISWFTQRFANAKGAPRETWDQRRIREGKEALLRA